MRGIVSPLGYGDANYVEFTLFLTKILNKQHKIPNKFSIIFKTSSNFNQKHLFYSLITAFNKVNKTESKDKTTGVKKVEI